MPISTHPKINVTKRTIVLPQKQAAPETAKQFSAWKQMTYQCGDVYLLGKTGTIYGCDRCMGITRNPVDNSIIPDPFVNVFGEEQPS